MCATLCVSCCPGCEQVCESGNVGYETLLGLGRFYFCLVLSLLLFHCFCLFLQELYALLQWWNCYFIGCCMSCFCSCCSSLNSLQLQLSFKHFIYWEIFILLQRTHNFGVTFSSSLFMPVCLKFTSCNCYQTP